METASLIAFREIPVTAAASDRVYEILGNADSQLASRDDRRLDKGLSALVEVADIDQILGYVGGALLQEVLRVIGALSRRRLQMKHHHSTARIVPSFNFHFHRESSGVQNSQVSLDQYFSKCGLHPILDVGEQTWRRDDRSFVDRDLKYFTVLQFCFTTTFDSDKRSLTGIRILTLFKFDSFPWQNTDNPYCSL